MASMDWARRRLPIVKNLDDTDLYKLTMGHFIDTKFGDADVTYHLHMRSDIDFEPEEVAWIEASLKAMDSVGFSEAGLAHLRTRAGHYLPAHYLEYLSGLRLDPKQIKVWAENKKLKCEARGPWSQTVYWEIPVMETVSEALFESRAPLTEERLQAVYRKAYRKGEALRELGASFIDMGSRRRRSRAVQDAVVRGLRDGGQAYFLGTSNVYFAAKYNLTPHGTMAHELFSAVAAMYGVESANEIVLEKWAETYRGNLGIALPDTFTTDFFLRTFDPYFAKLFDGLRHDSGDPLAWIGKILAHYKRFGISPAGKRLVFSDGISSLETVEKIVRRCEGVIPVTFGIGTWFTNDFEDMPALNMVFKLVEAQKNLFGLEPRRHAVKLSDADGKHNGDLDMVEDYKKRIRA